MEFSTIMDSTIMEFDCISLCQSPDVSVLLLGHVTLKTIVDCTHERIDYVAVIVVKSALTCIIVS